MITLTGDSVWPRGSEHGDTTAPSLPAIGIGLGRTVRFAGQTRVFYTVLMHTITVANLVDDHYRLYALLHDAAEAVVGDVPSTWKTDAARAHEDDLLQRISATLGLSWPWPQDAVDAVKVADARALAAEAHVLGVSDPTTWWPNPDDDAMIETALNVTEVVKHLDPNEAGYRYVMEVARAQRVLGPRSAGVPA